MVPQNSAEVRAGNCVGKSDPSLCGPHITVGGCNGLELCLSVKTSQKISRFPLTSFTCCLLTSAKSTLAASTVSVSAVVILAIFVDLLSLFVDSELRQN
jgi:hypothetical protein